MKNVIGALFGVALFCFLFFVILRSPATTASVAPPTVVQPNVIIKETGDFGSPLGSQVVHIWRETDGSLKFFVNRQKDPGSGSGPISSFKANSEWSMCWDSDDKLWTYVPELDDQYCTYWYANENGSGSCRVGEYGGWRGIPEAFFANLPEKVKAVHATYTSNQPQ